MPISTPSFRLKALLFLYGSPNICGCALALLGPLLLFAGLIGPGWLAITLGFYALGWLLAWMNRRTPMIERQIEDDLSMEETLRRLDALIQSVARHLSPEMNRHLASVKTSVSEVLPRLIASESFSTDLFTVRETVLRYLPETLANYLALPPAFRTTHPLKDGKTARQLLGEQLALLDTKMQEVLTNVASADAQALLVNGKFLEMKFVQPDFLAP